MNLNKCPCCKSEDTLKLHIDGYNTRYEEDSEGYDTVVEMSIDQDLSVIGMTLPENIFTYDKDRIVICVNCLKTDETDSQIREIRKLIKLNNPGFL